MLPPDPAAQVSKAADRKSFQIVAQQLRQIEDGDVFRLFTDDAKRLPLPHPLLLSLYAFLWRMIDSAGLAETAGNKRKRLVASRPYLNPDSRGGDDDDGDDDTDDEENDWASTRYGARRVAHAPKFLEKEFARFHSQQRGAAVCESPVSELESELDSDSGPEREQESAPAMEHG